MILKYRVSLPNIKGFARIYEVKDTGSLYGLHKQMRADMDFPQDQVVLFKAFDANGDVAATTVVIPEGLTILQIKDLLMNYYLFKEAEKSVRATTDRIVSADEDDRSRLSSAKKFYDGLTTAQKGYFDKDLLARLNKLIRDAENDHQEQERRRRQRRQQASYNSSRSSSSYRSSSSFGGRGGRPSGGGASRRF